MLKCKKCRESFDSDDSDIYNSDGEMWACCPYCGSTDIAEAQECRECGEAFFVDDSDDFIESIHQGMCVECAEKAYTEVLGVEFIVNNECLEDFKSSRMNLESYCLYDMNDWVDFLIETEKSNANSNYAERTA